MALIVASAVELVGISADEQAIRRQDLSGADQLVVAGERGVVGIVRCVAEIANTEVSVVERLGRRERAVVGEARVLGPDAGVDDTDDDTFTSEAALPCLTLRRETEEVAEIVGLLTDAILVVAVIVAVSSSSSLVTWRSSSGSTMDTFGLAATRTASS